MIRRILESSSPRKDNGKEEETDQKWGQSYQQRNAKRMVKETECRKQEGRMKMTLIVCHNADKRKITARC